MGDFIAIIINNLEKVKGEQQAEADARAGDLAARLGAMRVQLEEIEDLVRQEHGR